MFFIRAFRLRFVKKLRASEEHPESQILLIKKKLKEKKFKKLKNNKKKKKEKKRKEKKERKKKTQMIVRRLKAFSRFSLYYYETLLSSVTSKQKEINENYTNNIALFINDYLEILVEITGVSYFIRVRN